MTIGHVPARHLRKLNDAPFEGDHHRVRAIVGVELRQDVPDTTRHGVFGQAQVIGNLLVGVPRGNQLQHIELRRCQRLEVRVRRQLE